MNLIEQLGGYAKLKPHFITTDAALGYTHVYLHGNSHYCFLDDSVDYIIPERAILIKDVINALLEHRRQHNIYEIGDKIVSTLDGSEDWKNAICEILAFHKKMAITTGFSCAIHHYDYRHATPEEIKAGRRL